MEECEGAGGDVGDPGGVEGDVLEGSPGLFEQGVAAFGGHPHAGDEVVAGDRVGIEDVPDGVPGRDEDPDPGAGVALVGQRLQPPYCGGVERREGVEAGGGDVMGRPGSAGETHSGYPSGPPRTCTLPPCCLCFPEYHRS